MFCTLSILHLNGGKRGTLFPFFSARGSESTEQLWLNAEVAVEELHELQINGTTLPNGDHVGVRIFATGDMKS